MHNLPFSSLASFSAPLWAAEMLGGLSKQSQILSEERWFICFMHLSRYMYSFERNA